MDRLTDVEFAEIAAAIRYSYEAGTYPANLGARAREFLGPDGGLLALVAELAAERRYAARPSQADVENYLARHGWSPATSGPGGTLWTNESSRIGVPHESDDVMIGAVLSRLAKAEQRTIEATTAAVRRSAATARNSSADRTPCPFLDGANLMRQAHLGELEALISDGGRDERDRVVLSGQRLVGRDFMFPDDADEPLRQSALTAAARYRSGELTLEQIGARLSKARRAEAEARAAARIAGILAVRDGGSKSGTAARLGIDRMALLKWLGER